MHVSDSNVIKYLIAGTITGLLCACGNGESNSNLSVASNNNAATAPLYKTAQITNNSSKNFAGAFYEFVELSRSISSSLIFENAVPVFDLASKSEQKDCSNGGTVKTTISNSGKLVSSEYIKCDEGSSTVLDGKFTAMYSDVDEAGKYNLTVNFSNYVITTSTEKANIDGSIAYQVSSTGDEGHTALMNMSIDDSNNGELVTTDFSYRSATNNTQSANQFSDYSGQLGFVEQGVANVEYDIHTAHAILTGSQLSKVYVTLQESYMDILYQDSSDDKPSSGVRLSSASLRNNEVQFHNEHDVSPITVVPQEYSKYSITPNEFDQPKYTVVEGQPIVFDSLGFFTDLDSSLLVHTSKVNSIKAVDTNGVPLESALDVDDYTLSASNFSTFVLLAQTPGQYEIVINAVDNAGVSSAEQIINITVLPDSDGDGVANKDESDGSEFYASVQSVQQK